AELAGDGDQLRQCERVFDNKGNLTGIRLLDRVGQFTGPLTTIGQPVPSSAAGTGATSGYVPIFQALPTERVIGFGRASLTNTGFLFGYQILQITKQPSIVAPENASAILTDQLNLVDAVELVNLLAAYESFRDPLLAPALVRYRKPG